MPADDDTHHPHDKLFKAGFKDPVNAAAFLRGELPQAISATLDWDKLRLEPGSFLDSQFNNSESDLLFSVPRAGRKSFLHVLFEHQSTLQPFFALRLLRYMVRIWESFLRDTPGAVKLPVIIPVVLAQSAGIWRVDTRFSSLLDFSPDEAAGLAPFIPDFSHHLIQLAEIPFDAIRGTPAGILILRVMKAERIARLLGDEVWDESLILQVPKDIFHLLLRYILGADVDKSAFERRVQTISDAQTRTDAMTLAQQYRQEGRLEGRLEGILASRRQDVLEALEIRFTQVPEGLRETVEAINDEAKLRTLLRLAIQCASVEEFSASL